MDTVLNEDELEELVEILPYSDIPNTWHAKAVVRWFVDHGWRPTGSEKEIKS